MNKKTLLIVFVLLWAGSSLEGCGKIGARPTATPIPTPMPATLSIGDKVFSIAFNSDGSLFASGNGDNTIHIWDMTTYQEKAVLKGYEGGVSYITFTPDSSHIFSLGFEANNSLWLSPRVWDISTQQNARFIVDESAHYALALSPDGKMVAMDSCSGQITKSGGSGVICNPVSIEIFNPDTGTVMLTTDASLNARVWSMAFSPDSHQLAYGSADGTLRILDVTTGKEQVLKQFEYAVLDVAFSPDGSMVAAGLGDNSVLLWDSNTRNQITILKGHTGAVTAVAFSPDGSLLASGSIDHTIRLWDVKTGNLLETLTGHTDTVRDIAFHPNGSMLASGSYDGTIRFWSVPPR